MRQSEPDPEGTRQGAIGTTVRTTSPAVRPGAVARTVILPDASAERTTATTLPWYNFAWLPVAGLPSVRSALPTATRDRKSTRLNSSHLGISYAGFCLKNERVPRKPRVELRFPPLWASRVGGASA